MQGLDVFVSEFSALLPIHVQVWICIGKKNWLTEIYPKILGFSI